MILAKDESMQKEIERKKNEDRDNFCKWAFENVPDADKQVMHFIANVAMHSGEKGADTIAHLFEGGYCYYFAKMLETAFQRGCTCLTYPYGHFVWIDYNKDTKEWLPYDISGVSFAEAEEYVPASRVPEMIGDFLHVDGVNSPENIRQLVDEFIANHPEELFRKGQIPAFLEDERCEERER